MTKRLLLKKKNYDRQICLNPSLMPQLPLLVVKKVFFLFVFVLWSIGKRLLGRWDFFAAVPQLATWKIAVLFSSVFKAYNVPILLGPIFENESLPWRNSDCCHYRHKITGCHLFLLWWFICMAPKDMFKSWTCESFTTGPLWQSFFPCAPAQWDRTVGMHVLSASNQNMYSTKGRGRLSGCIRARWCKHEPTAADTVWRNITKKNTLYNVCCVFSPWQSAS